MTDREVLDRIDAKATAVLATVDKLESRTRSLENFRATLVGIGTMIMVALGFIHESLLNIFKGHT
jgi:hypothetical protein